MDPGSLLLAPRPNPGANGSCPLNRASLVNKSVYGRLTLALGRHSFWLLYAILACVFVLPIWFVVHPPAMDLPGHLALAQVVASRGTPGDPYAGLFTLPTWPAPNTLYYFVVGSLGRVLPLEWVSKLLLSLALLGTPLSLLSARRANDADPWPALFGFPLALTFNFIAGFVGFALALPLMIWLGALARRQIRVGTLRRALLMAGVGVLVYLAHAQVFLFSLGLVGLIALCGAWDDDPARPVRPGGRRLRRGLVRLAYSLVPLLVPVLLALPWYIDRMRLLQRHGGMGMRFVSVKVMLRYLPIHTFDQLRGDLDTRTGGLLVLGMVLLAVLAKVPRYAPPRVALSRDHRIAAWFGHAAYAFAALAAVICYFVLPAHIRFQAVINGRMAVVALLLLAAAIPVGRGRIPKLVLAATLAATVGYGAVYAVAAVRMNREIGDLRGLLGKARKGTKLVAPYRPRSRVFRMDVLRHVGSYHVVWNHGTVADTFARWPVQPIRITRRWRMPRFSLRRPDPYDYVLSGRPLRSRRLILLGRSGLYRLYGVR